MKTPTPKGLPLVGLDFETFYDTADGYTLRKMTIEEYVRDARFEVICLSVVDLRDGTERVLWGAVGVAAWLVVARLDQVCVVAHHAVFDAFILRDHFGIMPGALCCTMDLARPFVPAGQSLSLANLSRYFELQDKGDAVLHMDGLRLAQMSPATRAQYADYCTNDTYLSLELYHVIVRRWCMDVPWMATELDVLSLTLEATVRCDWQFDAAILAPELQRLQDEDASRVQRLSWALGLTPEKLKTTLNSGKQFAALLEQHGVTPPTKISPTTNQPTFAFAKDDEEFLALRGEHGTVVDDLIEARLGAKSSMRTTRTARFLGIARRGPMGWPAVWQGAVASGRWSATWAQNCMTGDHEVLTPRGWVRLDVWEPAQGCMQWWPDGTLEWCNNPGRVVQTTTQLVAIDSRRVSALVTPEHRFYTGYGTAYPRDRTAGHIADLAGHIDGIPYAGILTGSGNYSLTIAQARVLVMVAADGCEVGHGRARHGPVIREITLGFRRARKISRCAELLNAADVKYVTHEYAGTTVYTLRNMPGWLRKGFGEWVLWIDQAVRAEVITELQHWDGHVAVRGGVCVPTAREDQAQWIATLLQVGGFGASVMKYVKRAGNTIWHVQQLLSTACTIPSNTRSRILCTPTQVYCPQVPSTYILIRRDNKIYVTGNCQNLPKNRGVIDPEQQEALRRAYRPRNHGFVVVAADSSAVEARGVAVLAGQLDLVEQFRRNEDVYSIAASAQLGRPITKKDKKGRQIGKTMVLSGGFGAGAGSFAKQLKKAGVYESDEQAAEIARGYRRLNPAVVQVWRDFEETLRWAARAGEGDADAWGYQFASEGGRRHVVTVRAEDTNNPAGPTLCVQLPSGRWLRYRELRQEFSERLGKQAWSYMGREERPDGRVVPMRVPLYGGKIWANVVQGACRDVIAWQAHQMWVRHGLAMAGHAHDELIYVVPAERGQFVKQALLDIMHTAPPWLPDFPLKAEAEETCPGPSYAHV